MTVDKVLLAEPRGFCAGVEMAIKSLAWMVELFDPPVYCYHDIVHNVAVVDVFEQAGVVFVDDVDAVPPGAPLMLSAHGTAPDVTARARGRAGTLIDAACPLVAKVHHELATRASKGYDIVYVGHAGHDEAVGTMAVAPGSVHLVAGPGDVARVPGSVGPVALLSQTTLGIDEWAAVRAAVRQRFADVWMPARSDLCFATTNRQTALSAIADKVDSIIVIGSKTSSNTNALERVARQPGRAEVVRIETVEDLAEGPELCGVIGVTAGASVPEQLVPEVLAHLDPVQGVETVAVTSEDEYFPLPAALRRHVPAGVLAADRQAKAGHALHRLDARVRATREMPVEIGESRTVPGTGRHPGQGIAAADVGVGGSRVEHLPPTGTAVSSPVGEGLTCSLRGE